LDKDGYLEPKGIVFGKYKSIIKKELGKASATFSDKEARLKFKVFISMYFFTAAQFFRVWIRLHF
jgi:hypothetical protein